MKQQKKQITLEERKAIQLDMLTEIDAFCKENMIKYSLAFGTLLGAIRHKGFIPWDDDVDIMMPLPDMLRFKAGFKSEKLKYCDVDTEPHYEFAFSRISYNPTYNQKGIACKSYGISIDLYPVVALPDSEDERKYYFEKGSKLNNIRYKYMKWRRWIIQRIPISTIIGHDKSIRKARDFVVMNTPKYGSTSVFFVVATLFSKKDKLIHDIDLFDEIVTVPFEDRFYDITAHYQVFLSKMYGDYMTPPPEKDRHPYHGGHYYWK